MVIKTTTAAFLALLLHLTLAAKAVAQVRMAVISDVHVINPYLIANHSSALDAYIKNDRKMLRQSAQLMQEATDRIIKSGVRYVLISGDLTKDGETASHLFLRDKYLARMKEAGIRVFVVPGNHDVDNPHAAEYMPTGPRRVPSPKAYEFADIYAGYGYGDAVARDASSLSYVAQLGDSLRLLCLDACLYEQNNYNKNICMTGGRLKQPTIDFIRRQAGEARRLGMRMMVMMHHGVVQHWKWQEKALKEYLVDQWRDIADMMRREGIEVAFTGHFHSHDIARRKSLYDIETGSLVSYPSPIRFVTVSGNTLTARTEHLDGSGITLPDGSSLQDFSRGFARANIHSFVGGMLPENLPDALRTDICNVIARAYIAHLKGEEKMPPQEQGAINDVAARMRPYSWKYAYVLKQIIKNLWTDVPPEDNSVVIRLKTVRKR